MDLQDFAKVIRTRWATVVVTTVISLIVSVGATLLTTPLYEATTRLFVSTTAGASASDLYQGNRLSQDRVLSYTELLQGETLARRTIDKTNIDITAKELRQRVKATSKLETVLITLKVLDESPVQARDIANAMSDEFVEMVRELETPRPGARPDARVVVEQRADVPESPVVPKKARNLTIGLVLGLLLGTGLAVLRDLLDNTVKSTDTLEKVSGVGVVGTIPASKVRRESPAISFENDNSAVAEAFRKLRTNLQFLHVDSPPRLIVILSPVPSEGKSTTAINLALALAEADNNVVLVDGDMRKPSLHRYLDLVGSVGFSTVLSGGASMSEALQTTKYPRLTVLAAGPTPPNPSELLSSLAAQKTLGELRSQFDYVIIDSAPLLAVTDGAILAKNADGALMMAKYGQTKIDPLAQAVGNLRDVGASLLGAVLTMVPTRGSGSYNYNYYYSRYGEQRDGKPEGTQQEDRSQHLSVGLTEPDAAGSLAADVKSKPAD